MHFICIDEAGTSAAEHERYTVVAATLVHADRQWRQVSEYLDDLKNTHLPAEHRDGFVFHAKRIFAGDSKDPIFGNRELWPIERRVGLISEVLSARWKVGFTLSAGFIPKREPTPNNLTPSQAAAVRHTISYCACLLGCEKYLRAFTGPDEIAMVIAEDVNERKQGIERMHDKMRKPDTDFPVWRERVPFRHIVEAVSFSPKNRTPLLQYADAAAFALKRHLNEHDHSQMLIDAICGPVAKVSIERGWQVGHLIVPAPQDVESESGRQRYQSLHSGTQGEA